MYLNFNFPPLPFHLDTGPATQPPGTSYLSREKLDNFDLLIVFEGELHICEDGKFYDIKAGEFLILEPNKKHFGYKPVDHKTYFYWCHFDIQGDYSVTDNKQSHFQFESRDQYVQKTHLLSVPKNAKVKNEQFIYKLFSKIAKYRTYTNSLYKLEQQIFLHQILLHLATQNFEAKIPQSIKIAEDTIIFIEQNLKEDITYETLAQKFHLSSAYITRCFKNAYNCTPLEYLQKIRMETAVQLLTTTNSSIEEISEHTGYKTPSYFSKVFSDTYGTSPLKFRKTYNSKL